MPDPLPDAEIRRIARLARLDLSADQVRQYQPQLASILKHVETLQSLDVEGVEPLAHPHDLTNRLAPDEPTPAMPASALLGGAPAIEGRLIAVPRVLDRESDAQGSV